MSVDLNALTNFRSRHILISYDGKLNPSKYISWLKKKLADKNNNKSNEIIEDKSKIELDKYVFSLEVVKKNDENLLTYRTFVYRSFKTIVSLSGSFFLYSSFPKPQLFPPLRSLSKYLEQLLQNNRKILSTNLK